MVNNLNLGFLRANNQVAIESGRIIASLLSDHPSYREPLPEGVLPPKQLNELVDLLEASCEAAKSHDSAKIEARNQIRLQFNASIRNTARHLEIMANGDLSKLQNTGFDVRKTPKKGKKQPQPVGTPVPSARHGELSGTVLLRTNVVPGAGGYEPEMSITDPAVAANWTGLGIRIHVSKIEISGLVPGQRYWFRMRAIGVDGPGAWSVPISIIAL